MAARKQAVARQRTRLTARQKARAQRETGQRIAEARRRAGLTQKAVGESVGLSRSVVSKIERGERRLDPLELGRFARLFGTTIIDLVT